MGANDPRVVANLDTRGRIDRIYVGYHLKAKKIFSCFSHYKPMADNDSPRAWPIWTPGAWYF